MSKIEESKVNSLAKLQLAATEKKIQREHIPSLMEVNKLRVFDQLFFQTGVESEDINKAFIQYKLHTSAEFREIMTKFTT